MDIDNEIILKFQRCQTTPEEEALLMDYLAESEEHRRQFDRANFLFCASVMHSEQKHRITFPRWARAAAAIAILILGGAIYHFFNSKENTAAESPVLTDVIIEAPVGSQSRVELPDGSIVRLQGGSSLSYGASFDRTVSLKGEAYFDVQKNPATPFIVHTGSINIKVTGTVFNLKAYPEENSIETTLACGAVSLEHPDGHTIFQLRPGQQVSCTREGKSPEARVVDAWEILLDKYGVVTIPDASLTEICSVLKRVYGVEIKAIDDDGMPVTFSFTKESSISGIVSRLENISGKKLNIQK